MNEKIQFLSWCWRKFQTLLFGRNNIFITFFVFSKQFLRKEPGIAFILWAAYATLVILITIIISSACGFPLVILNILIAMEETVGIMILIILTVGILYDKFKEEQKDLIDRLKQ